MAEVSVTADLRLLASTLKNKSGGAWSGWSGIVGFGTDGSGVFRYGKALCLDKDNHGKSGNKPELVFGSATVSVVYDVRFPWLLMNFTATIFRAESSARITIQT